LLAREGKQVLGVDIVKESIDFAQKLKSEEDKETQDNVQFKNLDYLKTPIKEKFDTIILGEILEHLFYPEELIKKALKNLKQNGRILITTPFGINDYYDHKKTYYIKDHIKQLWPYFDILEVKVGTIGKYYNWVGISGTKRNEAREKINKIPIIYIQKLESTFEQRERLIMSIYKETYEEKEKLDSLLAQKSETIKDIQSELKKLDTNLLLTQNSLASKTEKISELKNEIELLKNNLKHQKSIVQRFQRRKVIRLVRVIKRTLRKPFIIMKKVFRIVSRKWRTLVQFIFKLNANLKKKKILSLAQKIPISNGSSFYKKLDVNIGIITDEFMFNYYKDAVNLHYINSGNYITVLEQENIDFLLFVSCWQGMRDGDWKDIAYTDEKREELFEIFAYARKKGVEIIFQTIEDPSNYQYFLPIAEKADYIFTSDEDKIEDYKKDTGKEKVFLLKYGINPFVQNPIGCNIKNEKKFSTRNKVFFAGSWAKRYKERCEDSRMIFEGVKKAKQPLIIADRNYYRKGYNYPSEFQKFLMPSIDHTILQRVHKLFDWNININSIKYSNTMCAMRVYELQALGSLVLSNYAISVYNQFPNIFTIIDEKEIKDILNAYSEEERYRMRVKAIRNVFSGNTVFDRLEEVFDKVELEKNIENRKKILILCKEKSDVILDSFKNQTYKNKRLCTIEELVSINIKEFEFLTFFSQQNTYGPYYLEDMINCFKFVDVPYVTKDSHFFKGKLIGKSHDFIDSYKDKNQTIFNLNKLKIKDILSSNIILQKGYTSDPFNFNERKYPLHHFESNKNTKLGVIVPVYNNGDFLYGKAFLSLLRSSLFGKMNILLVDDGSSYENTLIEVEKLARRYPNIATYCFEKGGSGSASRPRNKGVELLNTKYITYLDPDNEAINDGYEKLYKTLEKNNELDLAFGYIKKVAEKNIKCHRTFRDSKFIEDTKEMLVKKDFFVQSIQACIFKRKLIEENNISSINNSIGQDSLFFLEAFLNAKKALYLNTPIHIYYAERKNSVVNDISVDFFKKSLTLEKEQVKKLKKYNLLKEYKEKKYHYFMKNWYAKKLERTQDEDLEESKEILKEIAFLYGYDIEKSTTSCFKNIPLNNGSAYFEKFNKNIAIVTDTLAYNYLNNSANLFYLSPNNYKDILDNKDIDMFLFITCWRGMNNEDWRGISGNKVVRGKLKNIFEYCNRKGIPTVYWSKEDPPHYDIYHKFSKYADYIFTTSQECIPDYVLYTKNKNVFLSQYGINPFIHNPVGCRVKNKEDFSTLNKVLFAGSWYINHEERAVDQEALFEGTIKSEKDLVVIDRNYFLTSKIVRYPEKYLQYTYPSIDYEKLQRFQKMFDWVLNLNTVKDSETMCAARVFELQAQGIAMISNPSLVVEYNFPNIFTVDLAEEVTEILNNTADEEIYRRQVEGIRNVYTNSTVFERLGDIFHKVGLLNEPLKPRKITIICDSKTDKIIDMYNKQTYKNKELITREEAKELETEDFVTFFSEDYKYGPNYLQDMLNGFKYTDSAFITKDLKVEHNYVDSTNDKYRTIFNPEKISIEDMLNKSEFKAKGYSIDPFELDKIN
jgi:polyhydroxyalkanoate synthesis regulator phasin